MNIVSISFDIAGTVPGFAGKPTNANYQVTPAELLYRHQLENINGKRTTGFGLARFQNLSTRPLIRCTCR
ncbi:MAG: hypothetical protein WCA64_06325 [Gallionella sp.]